MRTAYVRHKYIIISGQIGPVDARSRDLECTKVRAHGLEGAGLSDGCKKKHGCEKSSDDISQTSSM